MLGAKPKTTVTVVNVVTLQQLGGGVRRKISTQVGNEAQEGIRKGQPAPPTLRSPCHFAGSVTRKSPLPGKSIQVMSPSLSLFPKTGSPPIEVTWTVLVSLLKVSMFLPKA